MIQLSLFDWADSQARKSDPATSKAARPTKQLLTALHHQFLERLKQLGQATSNEVAASIAPDNFGRRNTLRRRASDLISIEKIRVFNERICTVTNRRASVYEVAKKQTPQAGVSYRIAKPDSPTRLVEVFSDEDGTLMAQDISRAPHEFGYLTPVSDLSAYEFTEANREAM